MFQQREDLIKCINKAMAFLSAVTSRFPPLNNQLRTSSNPRNQATIQDGRVTVQQVQGRQTQSYNGTGNRGIDTTSKRNYAAGQPRVVKCYNCQGERHMARQYPGISEALVAQQTIPHNSTFQTEDLDAYDSDCDDLSSAKAVLRANPSSFDPEVLYEYYEQTHIDDFQDNEIHSDSNIIPYSQYLQESQDAVIQDTNSSVPNDLLQEINTLKETLSNHVKEKKSLSKTLTVFKIESKEKESKYIDKEIILEKQNKELENIICKMYRSTQAMHMLTKPQVFYDDTHKQALGYQNPFHLKKAQRIQPTLYDGSVIAKEHAVISVIDDEETLILEEESRSKMLDKQNDPISIEKKIKISPIDYSKLNKIKEDFGKRFVTQKELSAEQAFWLKHSSFSETPVTSHTPVRIEAPSELPKTRTFLSIDNDQILKQIMSQEIVHIAVNSVDSFDVKKSCVNECNKCLELETKLLKKKDLIEKDVYDKLLKSYSTLEKHCISLELTTQLNQEVFQKDNFHENQNAPTFNKLFELNELKARSQEKDTVIRKLKDRIKSLSGKDSLENVKKDIDEIEITKIELEHSVANLLSENENLRKEREHLKSIYKDQFDSIRKTRVQSKEHCDSLIAQINAKSVENSDLNAQLQEKVFAITTLKNELRKLKGKNVVDTVVSKPNATIAPGMFKLDIEPISHRLKNNRDAHEVYIEKTIEYTDTLRGFVERARTQNPSEPLLESACMFTKHVQELLVYVSQTCPNSPKPSEKLVAVTPMNKDKRVRFAEPVTSSSNIPKQTDSLKTKDSNKPLLTSTGVKPTTSASGSKPSDNTKNNRITRPPCSNQKNKVKDHSRKVKSSLNMMNSVSEPVSDVLVKHYVRNVKFESICAICNKCLFDSNHDMCIIDYVNVRSKSKSKRNNMRKVWKATGKVFNEIRYSWKPTVRTFTIVGNRCPLTRITSTKVVPTKETSTKSVATPTKGILVNSRRPKATRSIGSSSKVKIVASKTSNSKEPKQSWGSTIFDVPSSSLNDCRLSKLFSSIWTPAAQSI
ncbi:hypothetical protein Tco_0810231 [Tanacetum coccineum]